MEPVGMTSLTPFDLATAGVLTVRGGAQDGRELELIEAVTRIGRGLQADLILEEPTVSRRHAIIVLHGDHAVLHDDNSLNGTWCNGERVRDGVDLRHGDVIGLGGATLRYVARTPLLPR
jgi:pSer/pThr/pTyr-binding forkhead associated (FHA) protein